MTEKAPEIAGEIRKALDAATPGPWTYKDDEVFSESTKIFICGPDTTPEDAHLIANAPTWLRSLLEENERLKEQRDRTLAEWGKTLDSGESLVESLERITKENEQLHNDNARLAAEMEDHPEQLKFRDEELQQLREELEQLREDLPGWQIENADLRAELEQVKKERDEWKEKEFIACSKHHEFIDDIERLEAQLAEKDKVLEMFLEADRKRGAVLTSACGDAEAVSAARSILTRYKEAVTSEK